MRGGQPIYIAQIEVVGEGLLERKEELLEAMRKERERRDLHLYALMVTDVLAKGTHLLVAGDAKAVGAVLRPGPQDRMIELPGRDEPQEGSRAEAARGPVAGRPARAPQTAASCAGASPQSCSRR